MSDDGPRDGELIGEWYARREREAVAQAVEAAYTRGHADGAREERERVLAAIDENTGPTGGWICSPKKLAAAVERAQQPPEPAGEARRCTKVEHRGPGHLHAADDDSPYDVDGVMYCGRCHVAMVCHEPAGEATPPVEKGE